MSRILKLTGSNPLITGPMHALISKIEALGWQISYCRNEDNVRFDVCVTKDDQGAFVPGCSIFEGLRILAKDLGITA